MPARLFTIQRGAVSLYWPWYSTTVTRRVMGRSIITTSLAYVLQTRTQDMYLLMCCSLHRSWEGSRYRRPFIPDVGLRSSNRRRPLHPPTPSTVPSVHSHSCGMFSENLGSHSQHAKATTHPVLTLILTAVTDITANTDYRLYVPACRSRNPCENHGSVDPSC